MQSKYDYLIPPRDTQIRAMKDTFRTKRRLVWGVPGTGKTKIGVDFIGVLFHYNKAKKALIIAPRTALGVWEEHFETNAPNIHLQIMSTKSAVDYNQEGVILTGYDYFRPRKKKQRKPDGSYSTDKSGRTKKKLDSTRLNDLISWCPEIVIIDEGHKIKKPSSRSAKAVHKLGDICTYAMDLTGTPSGNRGRLDLWSHFRFLVPGLFGSFADFKRRYFVWGGFGGFKPIREINTAELDNLIKPYITVINKKGLEEKTFIPYRIELPLKCKGLYKEMEKEFIIEVDDKEIIAPIALTKIGKLQQISGGFITTNDKKTLPLHTAKLDAAQQIVEDLHESGVDRIVFFARYIWEIDRLHERFPGSLVLTGKTEYPKHIENVFNRDGGIVLCQSSVGSVSLSFHKTDYVIFYSTTYSHIDFTQAQYRIDRGEYSKPCFYYLLQCKGTIDVEIYRTLREHKNVSDEIKNIVKRIKHGDR